ncbi:hypothetical protein PGT21_009048 [Puccinia graminis f. sp. tritici]|uniref:Uncharacterized protein n=1 Tax=Puccinia graminis f. sp. tritici TaxID=56615 RepID=A0A5B0R0Q0_PUCGR|nr:hypothetical protein PGT21_009048 [Puccinia graminis f. sp. tritici]
MTHVVPKSGRGSTEVHIESSLLHLGPVPFYNLSSAIARRCLTIPSPLVFSKWSFISHQYSTSRKSRTATDNLEQRIPVLRNIENLE